jgi:hypothetical protein
VLKTWNSLIYIRIIEYRIQDIGFDIIILIWLY